MDCAVPVSDTIELPSRIAREGAASPRRVFESPNLAGVSPDAPALLWNADDIAAALRAIGYRVVTP